MKTTLKVFSCKDLWREGNAYEVARALLSPSMIWSGQWWATNATTTARVSVNSRNSEATIELSDNYYCSTEGLIESLDIDENFIDWSTMTFDGTSYSQQRGLF